MSDPHLFAPHVNGAPGVRFTDYEAFFRVFQVRNIAFDVEKLNLGDGKDYRVITLDLGQRHAWTFEFDEQGRLVSSTPDCCY
jgi:YD repeat-containing protein